MKQKSGLFRGIKRLHCSDLKNLARALGQHIPLCMRIIREDRYSGFYIHEIQSLSLKL